MGVEADTGNPWTPAKVTAAISGTMILRSVYDTLGVVGEDRTVHGNLAESITPNADGTVWTVKVRPGITFHDGTPLDAAAVQDNIVRNTKSPLLAAALSIVKGVTADPAQSTVAQDGVVVVDPMTVEVRLRSPSFAAGVSLAGTYVASPTWLAAADADATLEPKPVGTGPFRFKSYTPGSSFVAERNPDYWREGLPYLDEVEFKVIPDALARKSALLSGDIDVMHTTNGESIVALRDDDRVQLVEFTDFGETQYTLLNVGDPASPLADQRVRCALANAMDNQALIDNIGAGVNPVANGPFSPGQPGYLEDSGFPVRQDMAKARALIAAWKADNPGRRLELRLSTTTDQTNLVIAEAQQQFFTDAGVDAVEISQIEQARYILTALLGDFMAFQWRNHGGSFLDSQYVWWHSTLAQPPGQLALNFGRIRDPEIDRLLQENRESADRSKEPALAQAVNRRFAEQCYNLWSSWTVWGIASKPGITGIESYPTPDGEPALTGVGGYFWMGAVAKGA